MAIRRKRVGINAEKLYAGRYPILFFLALFCGAAVQAQEFRSGDWVGKAYRLSNGGYDRCGVRKVFPSRSVLTFSLDRDDRFEIWVTNAAWELDIGREYLVSLRIDHDPPRPAVAEVATGTIFRIKISGKETLIAALKAGHLLVIDAKSSRFEFSLDGSSGALRRLEACHAQADGSPPAGTAANPFATAPAPKGRADEDEDRRSGGRRAEGGAFDTRATIGAFLKLMRIADPSLEIALWDDVPLSFEILGAEVVWTLQGSIGVARFSEVQVDEDMAKAVFDSFDSRACDGRLESVTGSKSLKGRPDVVVIHGRSVCARNDGGQTHARHALYPMREDAVLRISHYSDSAFSATLANRLFLSAIQTLLAGK